MPTAARQPARTPPGPPPPPVVQRLRVRYAKRGRLRFSSHRDFQRALERALRRVEAPMAYSAGFTPHPRISYANAAPTGAGSEAEYLELALAAPVEPAVFGEALDRALPVGLDVVEVVIVRTPNLAERLQASVWQIDLPGVSDQDAANAVRALLDAERLEVTKTTKSGQRTVDVRAAVVGAAVVGTTVVEAVVTSRADSQVRPTQVEGGVCAILRLVVRHTTPVVRPDDVLAALSSRDLLAPPSPVRMTRLAQGPLDEQSDTVADPLADDRDDVGA